MRDDNVIPFAEVTGHHFFLLISTAKKKNKCNAFVPVVKSHKKSKLRASKIEKSPPQKRLVNDGKSSCKALGREPRVGFCGTCHAKYRGCSFEENH